MRLTKDQKHWLLTRTIKQGGTYMFPRFGFSVYRYPNSESGYMDTNPFTKSLDYERFEVKEIRDGYCRGNFAMRPKDPDFWLEENELAMRGMIEILLLTLICYLPFVIYNQFKGINKEAN